MSNFVVDAERAARVKVAIDYIRERSMGGMLKVIPEQRVDPQWLVSRDDLDGTVDVQIHDLANQVLEIIDYKDGMNDAWDSAILQMEQYAVGVLAGFRLPKPKPYPFKIVRLTVIQPKLALRGGQAIRSTDYTIDTIVDDVARTIVLEAAATDNPNAPLVPGDSQCKYCKAKGSCAALASNVMKEVGIMFQPTVTNPMDVAQQSADKDPTTMDDAQIKQIMEAAPLMRQLLEGVEAEALRRLQAGQSIPGLKLVNGRGSRTWALPEEQMAEKLVKMGVPKTAIYETKLVTPAKAEKLTWEKRDGTQMQLSDRQLKTMEKEYVVKMAGKLTVVPESDGRPAVVTNAAPMFSAVEAAPAAETLPPWLS